MWMGRRLLFEVIASFLWKTDKGTTTRKEDAREIKRLFLLSTPGRCSFWREVTEGSKRTGISWHLSVVYRRKQEELQWQTYIRTAEHPCTWGSSAVHPCSASVFFFYKRYPLERNISLKSKQSLQSTKIYLLMDLTKKGYKAYLEEIVLILPSFKAPLGHQQVHCVLKRNGIAEQ